MQRSVIIIELDNNGYQEKMFVSKEIKNISMQNPLQAKKLLQSKPICWDDL